MMKAPISVLTVLALAALTGCATTSLSQVTPEGQAAQVVWPEIVTGKPKQEGVFVNLLSLQNVGAGMTKYQVEHSIGLPQFPVARSEREWDYIFNFRNGEPGGAYVTCQYKVLFDTQMRARSFHWKEAACADLVSKEDVKPLRKINISADALFGFGQSDEASILSDGRKQLVALALELKDARDISVTVVGHTDSIGSPEQNIALSQARANTVRQIMIEAGVNPAGIRAVGAGESAPVKTCDDTLPRDQLVDCLQPNRRVEIEIFGVR